MSAIMGEGSSPVVFKEEVSTEMTVGSFSIERVIARRVRGGVVEYYVKWTGYGQKDNTWEPETSLSCSDLIEAFENARNEEEHGGNNSSAMEEEHPLNTEENDEGNDDANHSREENEETSEEAADENTEDCDNADENDDSQEEDEDRYEGDNLELPNGTVPKYEPHNEDDQEDGDNEEDHFMNGLREGEENDEEMDNMMDDEGMDEVLMNIKKEKHCEDALMPNVRIVFECEVCEGTFSDKKVLRLHKLTHKREEKLFSCSKCSFTCAKKINLKRHITSDHTEDNIEGFVRLRKSKIIAESSSENEEHEAEEELHAEDEKRTRGRRKRRRKINTRVESSSDDENGVDEPDEHDDESNDFKEYKLNHMLNLMLNPLDDQSFKCKFCDKEMGDKDSLISHESEHSGVKKYECKECHFKTNKRVTLVKHEQRYHNTKLYRCNVCSKSYSKKNDLKVHKLGHTQDDNKYPCEICPFVAHKKGVLMSHMRKKHTNEEKLLACTQCNFTSKYKATLVAHMSIHTGEYKFNCEYCDYKTSNPTLFKAHMLRHSSTTFYKCDQCPYETRYKGDLSHHVKTHSNLKPWCCSECTFTTRTNRLLQRHMEKHFQEKSFCCTECPFKTREKRALRRHLKRHAGGKTYKCSLCSYGSNTLVQIKRHNTRHHDGVGNAVSGLPDANAQDLTVSKEKPLHLPPPLIKNDTIPMEEKYHIDPHKKKLIQPEQPIMNGTEHINHDPHNIHRHTENPINLNPHVNLPVTNPNDYINKYPNNHLQAHPVPPNSNFSVMDMNFGSHFLNYNVQPSLAVSQNSSFPVSVPGFNHHFMNPSSVLSHNTIQHPSMPAVDMNLGFHGMHHDQNSQSSDMLIPITSHNMDYNGGFPNMNQNMNEPYNPVAPNKDMMPQRDRIYDHNKPKPKKVIRRQPGTGSGEEVNRPYACDECQFRSKCITNLTIHKRIHTGERPFPCKVCPKKFVSNSQLLRHERVHSAERPYACDQCNKCFNRKEILNKHKLVHSRVKDFKCDECKYATHRKDYLVEHRLKHSTERPFACDTCPYRTNRKYLLPKHKKMCTVRLIAAGTIAKLNEAPTETNPEIMQKAESLIHKRTYKCVYCEFVTKTNKELNKHMEIHSAEKHGGKLVIQLKYNQDEAEGNGVSNVTTEAPGASSSPSKRNKAPPTKQADSTDSFGQSIATKLKNLPENMREQTEQLLIDLLMKAEQGQVN